MTNELYDRILSLLPSADLREAIRRTGYRLPDRDLLVIAWRYAPDYDARIALLRELGEGMEGIAQMSYIPNPLRKVRTVSIDRYAR